MPSIARGRFQPSAELCRGRYHNRTGFYGSHATGCTPSFRGFPPSPQSRRSRIPYPRLGARQGSLPQGFQPVCNPPRHLKRQSLATACHARPRPDALLCCAPFCEANRLVATDRACCVKMRFDMRCVVHQPFEIRLVDKHGKQLLPDSLATPTDEPPVRIAPAAVFRRQVTPRSARAQDPNHCVDKPPVILCDAAPVPSFSGQVERKLFPDVIRDIMSMKCVIHAPWYRAFESLCEAKSRDYTL